MTSGTSGDPRDTIYKVVVIGDSAVGKSCFLSRYVDDEFSDNFITTIGAEFKTKRIVHKGKIVRLQLWDTAGQERFRSVARMYYKNAQAVIVMFDLTSPSTFDSIPGWFADIRQYCADASVVLVGNKVDLPRAISSKDAVSLSERVAAPYIETSCKGNINIQKAISVLLDQFIGVPVGIPRSPSKSMRIAAPRTPTPETSSGCRC